MSAQKTEEHPLAEFGYRRPPAWLWRHSKRAFALTATLQDIWLIVTARCSLHRAWQRGYDDGTRREYHRTVIMGGR